MKKIWKKMRDLLISITFSKPKEFDRLQKTKKELTEKRSLKNLYKKPAFKTKNKT